MKRIISLIFILAFALSASGQIDSSLTIPFVAYWSKGDVYNFKITKISRHWDDTGLIKNDSSSYKVKFEVLDSTDTRYKIRWSAQTNFKELNIPKNLYDQFSKYEVTEAIYQTSELGVFLGLENWEEVAENMKAIFTDLVEFSDYGNEEEKALMRQALQPLMAAYSSKEGVEQLVFKELQYIHFPFGVSLSAAEPLVYEEFLPNMLGGDPIRGDVVLTLEQANTETQQCVLVQEMKLNPDDTRKIIQTLFRQMGIADEEMKEMIKGARFEINDVNRYKYFYGLGIPIKIETCRVADIQVEAIKAKRVDILRIERTDQ